MPTFFPASDATMLAYHVFGDGSPLVCLPGGPMQASAYLGELGGLSVHRQLVMLDLRGTGESATPEDPASYRCDRLVEDVDALREHLGLERMDLLAHSAGANLAALYVDRHPERVGRLVLVTPSVFAVGLEITAEDRLVTAQLRQDEPWFESAFAALKSIAAGKPTDDAWEAIAPFFYGRWDEATRAHRAAEGDQRNDDAAAVFGAEGAYDPERTRAALGRFDAPVLLLVGEADLGAPPHVVDRYAGLFPNGTLVVQPGAGHIPWLDDPTRFVEVTAAFLR